MVYKFILKFVICETEPLTGECFALLSAPEMIGKLLLSVLSYIGLSSTG